VNGGGADHHCNAGSTCATATTEVVYIVALSISTQRARRRERCCADASIEPRASQDVQTQQTITPVVPEARAERSLQAWMMLQQLHRKSAHGDSPSAAAAQGCTKQ
jgi:hypothetical protein